MPPDEENSWRSLAVFVRPWRLLVLASYICPSATIWLIICSLSLHFSPLFCFYFYVQDLSFYNSSADYWVKCEESATSINKFQFLSSRKSLCGARLLSGADQHKMPFPFQTSKFQAHLAHHNGPNQSPQNYHTRRLWFKAKCELAPFLGSTSKLFRCLSPLAGKGWPILMGNSHWPIPNFRKHSRKF